MTLTLELPDDLAARMERVPPEQRNHFAVAALWEKIVDEEDIPLTYPLSEDEKAGLARAFADVEAGRVHSGESVLAEIRQRTGRTK